MHATKLSDSFLWNWLHHSWSVCYIVVHMTALLIMIVSEHSKLPNDVDIALQLPIPITIPALNHNYLFLNNNKCC
jgi:hypothetical protein